VRELNEAQISKRLRNSLEAKKESLNEIILDYVESPNVRRDVLALRLVDLVDRKMPTQFDASAVKELGHALEEFSEKFENYRSATKHWHDLFGDTEFRMLFNEPHREILDEWLARFSLAAEHSGAMLRQAYKGFKSPTDEMTFSSSEEGPHRLEAERAHLMAASRSVGEALGSNDAMYFRQNFDDMVRSRKELEVLSLRTKVETFFDDLFKKHFPELWRKPRNDPTRKNPFLLVRPENKWSSADVQAYESGAQGWPTHKVQAYETYLADVSAYEDQIKRFTTTQRRLYEQYNPIYAQVAKDQFEAFIQQFQFLTRLPMLRKEIESRLPDSPERDLMAHIALDQDAHLLRTNALVERS
jgi:hypothetical protein